MTGNRLSDRLPSSAGLNIDCETKYYKLIVIANLFYHKPITNYFLNPKYVSNCLFLASKVLSLYSDRQLSPTRSNQSCSKAD
ncbi:hypothetical protein COO91_07423 [Nostoc flagelliforme CCNUN1]|uniref:Uncharacterized protein n=1 Tax=Nostoc flagelliforme CCNUN1 TaxID=2038116 RepID=A0A2K8T2X7_9NOSO|nr:hypothetical protein [Nostoc flagelliforme]AUB41375.1 hypothetical protein COO91_07423 [Nostoc flagelliforme CCNUN1]